MLDTKKKRQCRRTKKDKQEEIKMKRKFKNAILITLAVSSFFVATLGACAVDNHLTWSSVAVITACLIYLGVFVYVNRKHKMFSMQDVM